MNESTPVPPTGPEPVGPGTTGEDRLVEDRLVERVRAADPAAGIEPDATVLRSAVDEHLARADSPGSADPARRDPVGGEGAGGDAADGAGTGGDELAAARARRRASWPLRVAGVAAAALVIGGGGGYALGAAGDGSGPASPAGEVITLQEATGAEGAADLAGPESTMAAPRMMGEQAAGDMSYWPGHSGRTVFTSSGLSEEGGSALAWAFDASQTFTEATVAQLAAAFDVSGAPVLTDGYWSVGPNDGTGPSVSLHPDGTGSVSYYDPSKDPWSCAVTLESEVAPDAGQETGQDAGGGTDDAASSENRPADGPTESMIAPDPCTQRDLGPAPQGDAAVEQARATLTAIGQDPATYELVAEDYGDTQWAYVTAYQVVDGERSGVVLGFSFTGGGLQSFNGSLAPVVPLGEYQVISPAEAVERLTDPRFGGGWGGPIAFLEGSVARGGDLATSDRPSTPTVPPTVGAGSAISWPVEEVAIVEARLGTALHTQVDGAAVLVPSYELVSADGGVWSMVAVADAQLDFASGR